MAAVVFALTVLFHAHAEISDGTGGWLSGTYTTGYWDCCKPSCSWPDKGNVTAPVRSCDINGDTIMDASTASVCDGGTSGTCVDQTPWAVSASLSYGFAAAAVGGVSGLDGDTNCGQCYELMWTAERHAPEGDNWGGSHPSIVGTSMVIQVTNIGYDVSGDHSFDIMIPAAGQGLFTSGCTTQFPGYASEDFDCGVNYGGCDDVSGCSALPESLQAGCEWRYSSSYMWLQDGGQSNNPFVKFRRVRCPAALTDLTLSIPLDDDQYSEIDESLCGSANGCVAGSSDGSSDGSSHASALQVACTLVTPVFILFSLLF